MKTAWLMHPLSAIVEPVEVLTHESAISGRTTIRQTYDRTRPFEHRVEAKRLYSTEVEALSALRQRLSERAVEIHEQIERIDARLAQQQESKP